jgi:hypothetical protein
MALKITDVEIEDRRAKMRRFLEEEVWPTVPEGVLGKKTSREEEDAILGYEDQGV